MRFSSFLSLSGVWRPLELRARMFRVISVCGGKFLILLVRFSVFIYRYRLVVSFLFLWRS